MIINYKGLVDLEIGGKVISFKFNMAAFTLLNDLQNCSMRELSVQLSDPKFSTFANFLYAGAETAYLQDGKNADAKGKRTFTQFDGPEWMNQLDVDKVHSLLGKAFEVPESKNDQPLETQGN